MNEPTNRADNVLRGPWPDPAIQEEREELTLRLGTEDAWRIEHGVHQRHLLNAFPDFQQAILQALRDGVAELVAKYPGRVGW
jgi:hypothetical protein